MHACTHTGQFISVPLCSEQSELLLFIFLSNLMMYNMKKLVKDYFDKTR